MNAACPPSASSHTPATAPAARGAGTENPEGGRVVISVIVAVALVLVSVIAAKIFWLDHPGRADPPSPTVGLPTSPPARICGEAGMLAGPDRPPAGSVRVDPGQNLNGLTQSHPPGTTFWLSPGTHTLGAGTYNQVIPKNDNVYVGAPGAILDGQSTNRFAFTQKAVGVTIRHLTIQNFGASGLNQNAGVVNHDGGRAWTVEYSTIRANAGAGLFLGSDNTARYNCLTGNGQYGFSMFRPEGLSNIVLDHNEVSSNNQDGWEKRVQGCGCAGGGKFWDVKGAKVTNNWVHDNKGVGLWADTDNVDFLFEGNYINDNDAEGIFYEISYNARIIHNTLKRNALVKGKVFAARKDRFPVAAIYISESGGDARVASEYSTFEITGNLLEDNWGGVILWENADRFCGAPGMTGKNYCTKGGDASSTTCVSGTINTEPYYSDCRWRTQNIWVHDNDFRLDKSAVACTDTEACGQQGILSNFGTRPSWSPYSGRAIQDDITFKQNNRFSRNRYAGDWRFVAYEPGRMLPLGTWQGAPYSQDDGSRRQVGG